MDCIYIKKKIIHNFQFTEIHHTYIISRDQSYLYIKKNGKYFYECIIKKIFKMSRVMSGLGKSYRVDNIMSTTLKKKKKTCENFETMY